MKVTGNRREFIRTAASATTALMATAHPMSGSVSEPQAQSRPISMAAQLRQLLRGPEPIQAFGLYDVLSAKLAEINGFKCLFFGGSLTAELYGVPNIGMLAASELAEIYRGITENVTIPLIADVDDLGGDPLSAYRNTKMFERLGLAGVYFEDSPQVRQRQYSYELLSKQEMVAIIHAAADARSDLVICANCAINSNTKLEEAVERGLAYAEAGADLLCFNGIEPGRPGPRSVEASRRIADRVKKPLLTGNTDPDEIPTSRLKDAGVKVAVYERPLDIALGAVQRAITELKNTGAMTQSMKEAQASLPREIQEKLLHTAEFQQLAHKYGILR